jgi:hypothetical protein
VIFVQLKEVHYYDSMNGSGSTYLTAAMRWIGEEARDTTKTYRTTSVVVDSEEWSLRDRYPPAVMQGICARHGVNHEYMTEQMQYTVDTTTYVPQQTNGFDCGMFVCMNADFTADDIPLVRAFSQQNMELFRQKVGTDILRGALNYTTPTYE